MFGFFNNWRQAREKAAAARESIQRQRQYEESRRAEYAYEREQKIEAMRVLTGDLKHRYAVVETLQGFGHYVAPADAEYDPMEATRRAAYHLKAQAVDLGADAVIHAQYQIVRYTENRGARYIPLPVYEVHVFGTAIRIVGLPTDWEEAATEE